jgi:hypothetical protein
VVFLEILDGKAFFWAFFVQVFDENVFGVEAV